jgi:protein-S-isoprenylcysteine O-methyltransferase Ste14
MHNAGQRRPWIAPVTLAGGALFAASLAYAAWTWATTFGTSLPWSLRTAMRAGGVDMLLFLLFVLHHSVFARPRPKAWVTRTVPPGLERSLYVWLASLLFVLMMGLWVPVPGLAWRVDGWMAWATMAVQVSGVALTALASRQLGVLELAGIRQAEAAPGADRTIRRDGLYGVVRHPIYFAWVLMAWPVAAMTGSRLLFAVLTTGYLVLAIPGEERALRREFGPAYDAYRREVRWRMLPFVY